MKENNKKETIKKAAIAVAIGAGLYALGWIMGHEAVCNWLDTVAIQELPYIYVRNADGSRYEMKFIKLQ